VRVAVGAIIAALVGGVWMEAPTTIFAQSGPTRFGGTTAPWGSSGAPGPTGPSGPAGPPANTVCTTPSLRLVCPDLVMSAPSQPHLDRSTIPGRLLLRAASSINNHGSGPLEIRARRIGANAMAVYQAIYDRSGHRHLFRLAAN